MPAAAQAQEKFPAPDYFITSVMATTTAQQIGLSCRRLSVNPQAMALLSEETLAALEADGFTAENIETRMEDPVEEITALQQDFLTRHGLTTGPTEATVCAAGLQEIAEESEIGGLLLEVDE